MKLLIKPTTVADAVAFETDFEVTADPSKDREEIEREYVRLTWPILAARAGMEDELTWPELMALTATEATKWEMEQRQDRECAA